VTDFFAVLALVAIFGARLYYATVAAEFVDDMPASVRENLLKRAAMAFD